ncbi:hypothetical protein C5C18_07515 [Rathayibacter tritici]|uniref:ABC transporter ATP-binding protein/permease n=1 Tax=Rathayibacter tritici TaxID=33888 RepID=UPI000CE7AFEB|nr:ATP-binding cassette domain-containing protein [Rathayibacter tritici]PPF68655.1 hypothetical protein C5C21_04545 [Rathayibacter tritici]PPG07379.1 hypothetical protein C5C18_07515 [Rathayibacter tritici]
MTALLELRGGGRRYGNGHSATTALSAVDLVIERGEFVAVIGPSGSGKSTLLNVLGLLDQPTSGSYRINGTEVSALREHRRDELRSRVFGFVFQASHVLPDDSVERNVAVPLRIGGRSAQEQSERVTTALARLGLLHRCRAAGRSLSGGERQRLAIARAVSTDPEVILADEPTGNLDSANGLEVIRLLQELHSQGRTVVVVTHDERVARAATRRIEVADGTVVADTGGHCSRLAPPPRAERGAARHRGRALLGIIGDALSAITLRPGRTALLLLAFLVGTGGLVAATGLAETASQQISQRLVRAALDEVTVSLPEEHSTADRVSAERTAVERIDALPGVVGVARCVSVSAADADLARFRPGSVSAHQSAPVQVVGGDSARLVLDDVRTRPSTARSLFDPAVPGRFAVLGAHAADVLGVGAAAPGVEVWVGGRPVAVVGLIEDSGRADLDSAVFVSAAVTDDVPGADYSLIVRTEPGLPAAVAEAVPVTVAPGAPGSVTVETVADLRNLRRGVATDLSALVATISLVLLGLAAVSAAAILFVSVQSRVAEIGLRRAVGASRAATAVLFLLEGALIGGAGGAAGAASGLLTVLLVSAGHGWEPVLSSSAPLLGIVAGLVTGTLASVAPALRAASIDPARAVRA